MSRRIAFPLVLLLALAVVSTAHAGILINGSSGHGWQPFVSPTESGNPFWDQHSHDGSQYNIGYYLTKTGGYAHPATLGNDSPALAPGDLHYWGSNANPHLADPLQTFQSGGGSIRASLHLTFGGNYASNEFGYYLLTDHTTLHPLFTSGQYFGTGANYTIDASFVPTGDFGLYLKTGSGDVFYSDASLNPLDDLNHQHFAAFQQSNGKVWIGVEDLKSSATEQVGDFNDILFSIQEAPEPSTFVLAACGLLGLVGMYRRRTLR